MKAIQLERHQRLRDACKTKRYGSNYDSALSSDRLRSLSNVLVIPELKLLYCYVPKVGCTSWKTLLLFMSGHAFTNSAHDKANAVFPPLSHFGVDKAREILSEYKSFMFVRNPFTRLLSAYRNKITVDGNDSWRKLLYDWLTATYPREAQLYNASSKNFTFTHFVRFYLSSSDKNEHWREIHKLCLPCHVHYDFIGIFDRLQEDSTYLISTINNGSHINLPYKQNKTNSSEDTSLRRFYSNIAVDLLRQLMTDEGVMTDMALFGFSVLSVLTEMIDKSALYILGNSSFDIL